MRRLQVRKRFIVSLLASILLLVANRAHAAQSFTPISLKVPIRAIYLSSEDKHSLSGTLHECQSSYYEDCFVDVTNSTELKKVLETSHSIPVGEYRKILVQTCKEEGFYFAKLKGTVQLNGLTYYTASGSNPLSLDAVDLDYVTVRFNGCQRDYELPNPLLVSEGETIDVSLFLPFSGIAWANLGPSSIYEGCVENADSTQSVCLGYPDVAPYLGKTDPKLETYSIFEAGELPNTAAGILLLLFDQADRLIGGATRRYYQPTTTSFHGNFDTPLRILELNADGSYRFENFGSTASTSYLIFPNFFRSSHTGKYISNNWGGAEFDYQALKW